MSTRAPDAALDGVTMTLHKLSAGSGYEYLTRQVAAQDTTVARTGPAMRPGPGQDALADYYAAQGEAPGRWVGSGLVGIPDLAAGDPVTAEQMRHLFGAGQDPLTGEPLGAAYRVHRESAGERAGFEAEVTERLTVGRMTGVRREVRSRVRRLMPPSGSRRGRLSAARWRARCSLASTAGSRGTRGSWLGRWPDTAGRGGPRSRGTT